MEKKEKIIGVCGTRLFDQNALHFISELKIYGKQHGYHIIAFSANSDSLENTDDIVGESQLFELCHYVDFCSLIILTETLKNKSLIQQIVDIGNTKQIPVFSLDGIVDGCYNLSFKYSDGFEQIVRHVIEDHGAVHVNMLAGIKGNSFSDERIEIYKKVLAEHGISFEEERLGYGGFWDKPSRAAVKGFLNSSLPKPDAIICANDSMALTTCSVLKDAGYRIPDDIIVTGFDGISPGKYHTPMLATCEPDYEKPIQFIIEETEKSIITGTVCPRDNIVNFKMIQNQSCGCTPKIYHDRNRVISTLYHNVGDCAWHNISMNQMVTSMLQIQEIMDVAKILPSTVAMWSDHFHFACVKASLLDSCEVPKEYGEMVTILRSNIGNFEKPGEKFPISDFLPRLMDVIRDECNILIVRLLHSGKEVYGYAAEGFYEPDDRSLQRCNEFAMFLSHSINTVLHNKKLHELNQNLIEAYNEISSLSFYDPMTGSYNRRGFFREIEKILSENKNQEKYLYIISLDIDNLKYINDTYGHAEGDFAIITLSSALAKTCGEGAICARFGGDEFICAIVSDSADRYQENKLSQNINTAVQNTDKVAQKDYPIAGSLGLCCCPIRDVADAESLIVEADKKMYVNKASRKRQK